MRGEEQDEVTTSPARAARKVFTRVFLGPRRRRLELDVKDEPSLSTGSSLFLWKSGSLRATIKLLFKR